MPGSSPGAASLAVPSARDAIARADQEKAAADKALADARSALPGLDRPGSPPRRRSSSRRPPRRPPPTRPWPTGVPRSTPRRTGSRPSRPRSMPSPPRRSEPTPARADWRPPPGPAPERKEVGREAGTTGLAPRSVRRQRRIQPEAMQDGDRPEDGEDPVLVGGVEERPADLELVRRGPGRCRCGPARRGGGTSGRSGRARYPRAGPS